MSEHGAWIDLGAVADLRDPPLRSLMIDGKPIALSFRDGHFGAISGVCNHAGGPLGQGTLDGEYVVCPWHHWKFHCRSGLGEPGFEEDRVPSYQVEEREGHLHLRLSPPLSTRQRAPHAPHPLARTPRREPGPQRVVGISTTAMDRAHPRYSTSEALLDVALDHAREQGCEARRIRLDELQFRSCEGYYSKSARACTWPCSITQMDDDDQLDQVYEAFVHWGDVLLVATPIRWGSASSLYYKMAERLNCVQNQITLHNRVLMRAKVAAFLITGGQDNVQAVAGQMLGFFGELGCVFPPFPFVAHSRGWAAEDMENNVEAVRHSAALRDGTRQLVDRALALSAQVLEMPAARLERGGRKAYSPYPGPGD